MTPDQIELVEDTVASLDLDALAADFYRRAFAADPALSAMFTTDPAVQRARFAAELDEIVRSIRSLDTFAPAAMALGARHRGYGVAAAPLPAHGRRPCWPALAAALGDGGPRGRGGLGAGLQPHRGDDDDRARWRIRLPR